MSSFFSKLRAIPEVLVAYGILRSDVELTLKDPAIRDAMNRLKADPAVASTVPRISAEWRAVEESIHKLR